MDEGITSIIHVDVYQIIRKELSLFVEDISSDCQRRLHLPFSNQYKEATVSSHMSHEISNAYNTH